MNEESNFDRRWSSRLSFFFIDRGGRRSSLDRRFTSYTVHIPERRSGIDRRCGKTEGVALIRGNAIG
jgi:hypothetical protein